MINVDKARVEIDGDRILIKSEIAMLLNTYYRILCEDFGEKQAKKDIDHVFHVTLMTDEEMEEKNKKDIDEIMKNIDELPLGIALALLGLLKK